MALRWMDSFDHYVTADIGEKYDVITGAPTIVTGRFGTALNTADNNTRQTATKILDAQATWTVGFALKLALSAADKNIFEFVDGATIHLTLNYQTSTGKLYLSGPFGTALSSIGLTNSAQWYYVEMKVTINNTTGAYELRIDGSTQFSATNVDTQNGGNASVDRLRLCGGSTSGTSTSRQFDDFYACDGTGSAPTNTFLGDCRVECLSPNGDGNSSVLAGSDGNSTNNYLLVDEATPNDDTDYVSSATPGDKDTYAYSNMNATAGTVFGVQPVPAARKDDAGARSIVTIARLSGTEVDGPVKTMATTYAYYADMRETKPGGGSWSISDVNSAEFGVKINA